jgi:hypothetical protein
MRINESIILGGVALIWAQGAENISTTGNGMLDGQGGLAKRHQNDKDGNSRSNLKNILFISCRNVNVFGVFMNNSQIWNQHYLDCENVMVGNIRVFNHCAGNNDGIDIDGCRQFMLSDSIIDADDDGIVLKSTGAVPCEDITINNCVLSSHANAIKCGTESIGGFRNIAIAAYAAYGVSFDQELIWDVFNNYQQACAILNTDAVYSATVSNLQANLLGCSDKLGFHGAGFARQQLGERGLLSRRSGAGRQG